ncbi:MAG: 50S ribosomal protein L10 [Atribacterota bacterium]
MEKSDKTRIVEETREKIKKSQAIFVVGYSGIPVQNIEQIRKGLRGAQSEMKVVKNTLMRLALSQTNVVSGEELLKGQNAFVFSYFDPVQTAKVLSDFNKKFPQLEARGGWLGGKCIGAQEAKRLAEIPSREELLAQLLGRVQAPIAGLVFVLQGVLRNLVGVLRAIEEKKK